MSLVMPTNYTLKTPSNYFPSIEIEENSNRNANGKLIREIIAEKIKLNLNWNHMVQSEMRVLQELRRLGSFQCSYLDLDGFEKTIEVYCAPITATPSKCNNGIVTDWIDISANFIEL